MNSPFMGQQVHGVGNCRSFTLTHYLANLFAMHCGTRSIPLCIQHHIQLTALSFQVSWRYHSWDTAISIFYLENPRSKSSGRSMFKVTIWFQHPIDSNPVFPMSFCPPIPMTQIFSKISSWKSKVKATAEGHIVGITLYRLISLSFVVNEPSHSYIQLFKHLTLKIQGQGHGWGERWKSQHGSNILSSHIPFVPC